MDRILISLFLILALVSCRRNKEPQFGTLKINLYESYNLIELSPALLGANQIIKKYQKDSISNNATGLVLLDNINKEKVNDTIVGNSPDDFPLFKVLVPKVISDNYGNTYFDTSAIIGFTRDSEKLLGYLKLSDSIFPSDINWKISGKYHDVYKCLLAIKSGCIEISLNYNDIDSVIFTPTGPNYFGGIFEKISDIKDLSKYLVEIKLNKNLSDVLSTKSYSMILNTDSFEYSGSVVNFINNPEQSVMIGEMGVNDFETLKSKFKSHIRIKQ